MGVNTNLKSNINSINIFLQFNFTVFQMSHPKVAIILENNVVQKLRL